MHPFGTQQFHHLRPSHFWGALCAVNFKKNKLHGSRTYPPKSAWIRFSDHLYDRHQHRAVGRALRQDPEPGVGKFGEAAQKPLFDGQNPARQLIWDILPNDLPMEHMPVDICNMHASIYIIYSIRPLIWQFLYSFHTSRPGFPSTDWGIITVYLFMPGCLGCLP